MFANHFAHPKDGRRFAARYSREGTPTARIGSRPCDPKAETVSAAEEKQAPAAAVNDHRGVFGRPTVPAIW